MEPSVWILDHYLMNTDTMIFYDYLITNISISKSNWLICWYTSYQYIRKCKCGNWIFLTVEHLWDTSNVAETIKYEFHLSAKTEIFFMYTYVNQKKIHSYNLNSYRYKINTCFFLNLNFTFLIMLFCVVCGFMCMCMYLRRYSVFQELEL